MCFFSISWVVDLFNCLWNCYLYSCHTPVGIGHHVFRRGSYVLTCWLFSPSRSQILNLTTLMPGNCALFWTGTKTHTILGTNGIFTYPIGSMYGIVTYIYHQNQLNVGKYTIHGSYGYMNGCWFLWVNEIPVPWMHHGLESTQWCPPPKKPPSLPEGLFEADFFQKGFWWVLFVLGRLLGCPWNLVAIVKKLVYNIFRGRKQTTYIGIIIHCLSPMDIPVLNTEGGIFRFYFSNRLKPPTSKAFGAKQLGVFFLSPHAALPSPMTDPCDLYISLSFLYKSTIHGKYTMHT